MRSFCWRIFFLSFLRLLRGRFVRSCSVGTVHTTHERANIRIWANGKEQELECKRGTVVPGSATLATTLARLRLRLTLTPTLTLVDSDSANEEGGQVGRSETRSVVRRAAARRKSRRPLKFSLSPSRRVVRVIAIAHAGAVHSNDFLLSP